MAEVLDGNQLESTTVAINRTSTTVKGGRRLSFAALVVVGNRDGSVGIGYGKGRGVPVGIEKAQKEARKNLVQIQRLGGTVPHQVLGKFCASSVRLIPAAPGTGVIAGGTVRAVLEMAGIKDCLTKVYGSTSKINLCRAVLDALKQLRTREQVAALRGVTIEASTVDEVLEANKRYMVESDSAGPKKSGPQNTVGQKTGRGGSRGGGGRSRSRAPQPSTAGTPDAGGATAVAEPPAPEAAAPEAAPPAAAPESAPAPEATDTPASE